jgi:hypothetical protein
MKAIEPCPKEGTNEQESQFPAEANLTPRHFARFRHASWQRLSGSGGERSNQQPGFGTLVCQWAKSHTVEVAVYLSHSKEVADVIENAARAVAK